MSSIEPPEYCEDDFRPSFKSVDGRDPVGIDAPEHDPSPEVPVGIDEKIEPNRPFAFEELPGRKFTAAEAAEEAKVSKPTIYAATNNGRRAVCYRKLVVYRLDEAERQRPDAGARDPKIDASPKRRPKPRPARGSSLSIAELREKLEAQHEAEIEAVHQKYRELTQALDRVEELAANVAIDQAA